MKRKLFSLMAALTVMLLTTAYSQVGIRIDQNNFATCAEDGSFTISPTGLVAGDTSFWDFTSWPTSYTGDTASQSTNTFSNLASGTYIMKLSYLTAGNPLDSVSTSITVARQSYVSLGSATGAVDSSGNFTVSPALFLTSTDSCVTLTTVSPTTVNCSGGSAHLITLTITETDGTVYTETPTITLTDTISPDAQCKDTTVYLDANGVFGIDSSYIENGSWDNCSIETISLSKISFTCTDTGVNTITMTVTDAGGLSTTCTATVTVVDTTAPTISCQSVTVDLDASGNATITADDVDGGSTDNCGLTLTLSETTFNCFNIGQNNVTLTGTDPSGNTATGTAIVTVVDNFSPTIVTKDITVYLNASNNVTITISDIENGSFDNCGVTLNNLSQTTFTCADVGLNQVTLTGIDISGNFGSAIANVIVVDNLAPVAICKPAIITLNTFGIATLTTADVNDGSSDNCSVNLSLSLTTFNCFYLGANIVTLTATDAQGLSSNCSTTVTVIDNILPTVICNSPTVYLNAIGLATITVGDIDNGSFDNCAIASMTISNNSFDCSNIGTNPVTLTVTDASGNVSTCTSTVTVVDNTAPVASCQDITVYLDATGNAIIDYTDTDNGSTDNCGIATIALSQTVFTCSEIGANTVTVTVTDNNGNTSTCSSTVTVIDNVNPTANCKNATVYLDATGNVSITTADVNNTSTDNCAFTMSLSNSAFTCADVGVNAVTLSVTDASGNLSVCTSNVTVIDNILPTVICNSPTVYLNAIGLATITVGDIDNGSFDNCVIASMTISNNSFDCSNTGTNTVTLTLTDASGNTSVCSASVTVIDTNSPNTATISASLSTICLGASSTLTANSGSGYTYSWSNSLTIIGTSQSITVSPNSTTIYSVTLTSSSGCSSITTSDTIIVTPIVQATIIGPSAVCIGDSATLTANSGTSYLWSNGATTQSITVNPSSSTSYSVSVVNSGCSSNSSVSNVIVNPLPTVQAGNDQTICQGTAISLSANSGSGFAYSWSNSSIIGNTQSITVSPSSTSTYTVAVTDTNGCINSDQVTVNVTQLANPQIVGEDSVCQNSYNNLYSINSSNTNLVEWIVFNGDIQGLDGNSKNVLVNWYDNTLPAYIAVKETIAGSSCYKYDTLFIKFLNQSALDPTTINPLHPGSKILVASNSYPDMNWGYEAKNSGATIYVNGHNQYYEYSFIDTINFYYWVEVGDGNGCLTKSYYNSYVYYLNLEKRINTLNEINIYPNPVQDRIFIKGINNKISVKVFDQTGRLIDEYNMIKNEGNSIDVSNYSPGIYYLIFKTKKNIATHKFIKIP